MSNFAIFYDACSPNMAMSRDPRSKLRKNLFFLILHLNIRKSYKISSKKALYFRSYQSKISGGGAGKHPSPFGVKKTKFIVFRNGGKTSKSERFFYRNRSVEIVTYLGLIFSLRNVRPKALSTLASQVEKACSIVREMIW